MAAVTRIGDNDSSHCSGMTRAQGSGNVFVNGRPVSCQSHNNTVHKLQPTPCGAHAAAISSGSTNVKVNNLGIGRVGDVISGCTTVAVGSQNVFANGQPS